MLFDPKNIEFIHFNAIDSTNTWAKKHASELSTDRITCITAREQTAGRGRWKRSWLSPKDQNIYATIYFCIPKDASYLSNVPQILSLACAELLEEKGFAPQLKWPNDVLVDGKKIAGLLCEAVSLTDYLGVVLGIGLNVNMQEELLVSIDQPATSLAALSGVTWEIEEVLSWMLKKFLHHLEQLQREGFAPFHKQFDHFLAYKDKSITVNDGFKQVQGVCAGLTEEGHLILVLPAGERTTISSGEILFD